MVIGIPRPSRGVQCFPLAAKFGFASGQLHEEVSPRAPVDQHLPSGSCLNPC